MLASNASRKALELEVRQFQTEVVGHVPALLAFARRLCRNEAEAEDLVQDTVIKAIRARKQFQPGTHLKAWLIKILRNAFINRYHRSAIERSLVAAPVVDPIADGWMSHASLRAMRDPEGFALRPELREALIAAIDRLPQDFKEVVLLADAEGLSYKEVAEVLECPMGTVMSRLHRARRLLKNDLMQHAQDLGIVESDAVDAQSVDASGPRREHGADNRLDADNKRGADNELSADKTPIELETYRSLRASGEPKARRRS